jgi:phosphoglucomutase
VEEQSFWDGNFPTCPYPNPEYDEVFDLAIEKYCGKDTDIIVATDPDSDRMGVMARWQGGFRRLTGNQVGVLMLDYICHCLSVAGAEARATAASALPGSTGRQLAGKIAYKSYVSSPMAEDVARYYGVEMKNVPTGFKNIAAEMERLKSSGHETDFLFGFEESLGYLYGNYTRDKDGVLAVQMICLMAACLKAKGKTLFDKMEELYVRHGYSKSLASSVHFESEMDRENIDMLMKSLFSGQLESLMGQALECDFSGADMSLFSGALPCGDKIIVRPSGTEMKVKIYVYAKSDSGEKAEEKAKRMLSESEAFVQDFCGGRNLAERRYALKIDTKAKKGIL